MKIKVVSFDIFQTLVDVNQRIPQIWKGILGEAYTVEDGLRGANAILEHYPGALQKALYAGRFHTMREVYLDCAFKALGKLKLPVSPEVIVDSLLIQHGKAPLYHDVKACMERLRGGYQIILSSDSNHTMVNDLLENFIYDKLFISDDLHCYKGSPEGSFFRRVLHELGIEPNEMIHVGDSSSDVLGAKRAGVISCWINRDNSRWVHDIKPDYTIESLIELTELLEGEGTVFSS